MKENNKQITKLLLGVYGMDVSKYDATFLTKAILKRITDTNCNSEEEYTALLKQSKVEADKLFASLHISYSSFFRNPLTFAVLESIILPSLIAKKKNTKSKEIRIWSAACAAGQEAYSLAMLLEEMKSSVGEHLSYRIFATDICEDILTKARKGSFSAADISQMTMNRINNNFSKKGDTYNIKPALKKHITFSYFDLLDGKSNCPPASIFGDFDLVFCSNILFYYKPEFRKSILDKMSNCIAAGGYLVTGETERDIVKEYGFKEVYERAGVFNNK